MKMGLGSLGVRVAENTLHIIVQYHDTYLFFTLRKLLLSYAAPRNCTTVPPLTEGAAQYAAQSAIKRRRLSNSVPRA